MKKNIDKDIQIANDLKNGIVAGIKVERVPLPGMGVSMSCGSDSYGYVVGEVSKDGTWFTYGRMNNGEFNEYGKGVLVTRKNANGRGIYREGYIDKRGKLRPTKMDVVHVRCSSFGNLWLTGEFKEAESYRDPSF